MPLQYRAVLAACCLLTGSALALRVVSAQTPGSKPAPAPVPPPAAEKKKMDGLDMDDVTWDAKTDVHTGKNFKYTEGDMIVTGNTAHDNHNKKLLLATGNLIMDDPKHHVTGGKADVDYGRKKLAVLTDNIVIVLKPEPDTPGTANPDATIGSERRQGVVITCDRVEDYYKRKFTILKGHLVFRQKIKKQDGKIVERTLFAEHAEYDGKTDQMHLFAPVNGSDTDGQEAKFEKDVFVGTKEGEETLKSDGPSHFTFPLDKSDGADDETPEPSKR